MVESGWSLIPPLLAILMVLLTRRVLLSLGVGIIASALFIAHFNIVESLALMFGAFKDIFIEDGGINTWNVYILLFIPMLGVITAFVSMMGGTKAFGDWMVSRVKSRTGAQIMTFLLGIVLFIDDYFNSLTVGQIARPVTDKHRISRAKLAYIVDSTAAPVCVVAPISSWGAYIIGLIGSVFTVHHLDDLSALTAFLQVIPMNFYVWSALGVVVVIAIRQNDFGPMKKHEQRAIDTGELQSPHAIDLVDAEIELPTSNRGKLIDLIVPILTLFIVTVIYMYWNGLQNLEGAKNLINIFGSSDVSVALLVGGATSIIVASGLFLRHARERELTMKHYYQGIITGIKSMIPAFIILIFAWAISDLINQLGTGVFLAEVVKNSSITPAVLPFIVFVMAGFIAFATGTSWGAFALLIPIGGQIAVATNTELLLPMIAAVLAGSVFGDHCSPISDTTILSSTGSNCNHIDHVITQLPYAIVAAIIAGIGYLVLGFTGSITVGLLVVLIGLVILFFALKKPNATNVT